MTSREQFEAQIRLHTDESEIEERLKNANGGLNYAHPETDVAWIWWQASREAVEVVLPPAINTEEIGRAISKERTMTRLSLAGIKVIKGEKKNG